MHDINNDNYTRRTVVRAVMYIVLGVLTAVLTLLMVLAAQGYDINRETGEIIHNGLVIVKGEPVAAKIYINGRAEDGHTPGRLSLPEGRYTIGLKAEGYRSWSRSLSVQGSGLSWLSYPLLIPTKLQPEPVATYTRPGLVSQSPDQRWLLVQRSRNVSTFDLYDLNNPKQNPTAVKLSSELLVGSPASLRAMTWADDNRHLLLKQATTGRPNYLVLDAAVPSRSQQLGLTKGVTATDAMVEFRDGAWDELLVTSDGVVRRLDLDGPLNKVVLAKEVLASAWLDDRLYVARSLERKTAIKLVDDGQARTVYSNNQLSSDLSIQLTSFEGNSRLILWDQERSRVYVLLNPEQATTDNPVRTSRAVSSGNIKSVLISPDQRFICVQGANELTVLDFGDGARYRVKLKAGTTGLTWLDDFRFRFAIGQRLYMMDFDGSNVLALTRVDSTARGFLSSDLERLFSLRQAHSTNERILELTSLLAD